MGNAARVIGARGRDAGALIAQWVIGAMLSAALIGGAYAKVLPLNTIEVWGFVTGGISVWLTVRVNIWNWPVGIANSVFYIIIFFTSRLYADMCLQVFFIVLGILGWYWWLRGGERRTALPIAHVALPVAAMVGALVVVFTGVFTIILQRVQDTAPFLDALITTLSLAATYLMTKKYIENWYVWIVTDVISIGLYAVKHLPLTAILYAIYLAMCIVGVRRWRREYEPPPAASLVGIAAGIAEGASG